MPDDFFTVERLPGKAARYVRIDLSDDGVTCALIAEFPEGTRLTKATLWGNKRVEFEDIFGRHVTPLSYRLETSRARLSSSEKTKMVSIVPGISKTVIVDPGQIFASFDAVLALDTNTIDDPIGGDKVSVLGVAISRVSRLPYPKLVHINARHAIEFRNLKDPKEKYGWIFGLKAIYNSGWLKPELTVAIVVDAFANEIVKINEGGAIIDDLKLPENVKLAYASSDTGQFFAINKCLRAADQISSMMVRKIVKEPAFHQLSPESGSPYFRAIRYWEIDQETGRTAKGTIPSLEAVSTESIKSE